MKVLVDARPLLDPNSGGVKRVAMGLLPAVCAAMPGDAFVFATARSRELPLPLDLPTNAQRIHRNIPSKLVSASVMSGLTSFDRLFPEADILLLPNLGFVGRPRIPYALVVHDISFLIEPRWFSPRARLWHAAVGARHLLQNATHLLAVSQRTARDLTERLQIHPDRIGVITLGTSWAANPTTRNERPPKRFVLALGGRDPRKNAACARRAVENLRHDARYRDLELIVVGDDYRPSDEELASLYQQASAFLYPSWYEGFGLPLHEAAAYGTPCIASTTGALPDTAPTGTVFAPPAKPHLWTEALRQVLEKPERFRTSRPERDWSEAGQMIARKLLS